MDHHFSFDNMDLSKLQDIAKLLQEHQQQQQQEQDHYNLHLSPVDQTIVKQEIGMADLATPIPSQTPPPNSMDAWDHQLGHQTPMVKAEPCDSSTSQTKSLLKASIQSRRRSKGQPDFQGYDLFETRQESKLTAADKERRERRREQNRRAARKCRNKRKEAQEKNMQDIANAMTRKELLEQEVGTLRRELAQLCQIISAHTTSGCCLIPNDSTTQALLSALRSHHQTLLSDSGLGEGLGDESNVDFMSCDEASLLLQMGCGEQYDPATVQDVRPSMVGNTQSTNTMSRKRKIPPSPLTVSPQHLHNKRVCHTRPSADCQIVPSTSPNLRKMEIMSPLTPSSATSPHDSSHNIGNCSSNVSNIVNSTTNNACTPTCDNTTARGQIFNFENVAPVISPTVNSDVSDNPWPISTAQPSTGLASIGFEMEDQQMFSFESESDVSTSGKQLQASHVAINNLPSWDLPNLQPLDLPDFTARTRLLDTSLINITQPKPTSDSDKISCVRDLSKDFTACRPQFSSTPKPVHVSTPITFTSIDEPGSGLPLPPSYTSTHTAPSSTPVVSVGELLSQDTSSMTCVSPAMVQPYDFLPQTAIVNSNSNNNNCIRYNEKNNINCNTNTNGGSYIINDNNVCNNNNNNPNVHNPTANNGSQELHQLRQLLRLQQQGSSFLLGQPNFLEVQARPSS